MSSSFKRGVLGGTFDHFHVGHRKFIDTAFQYAEKVIIGLSQVELYIHKPFAESIESYTIREENLKQYLKKKRWFDRASIVPIHDVYGVTLKEDFNVIFATSNTQKGVEIINTERRKNGLYEFEVVLIEDILADDGKMVSSERIRGGEIDRNGNSYFVPFEKKKYYTLPDSLKEELRTPAGIVVSTMKEFNEIVSQGSFIVTVGDVVTSTLLKSHMIPAVSFIDFRTRRHEQSFPKLESFKAYARVMVNKTGTINCEIADIYKEVQRLYILKKDTQPVIVVGEEDLLALPAILFAPLDSYVIYGLFNAGMVVVKVTEEKKQYIKKLLEQFE